MCLNFVFVILVLLKQEKTTFIEIDNGTTAVQEVLKMNAVEGEVILINNVEC